MRINQLIIASLKSEIGEADAGELKAWREASPENERHIQEFAELWHLAEGADDAIGVGPPATAAELVKAPDRPHPKVVPLATSARDATGGSGARRGLRQWPVPVAAAAVVVVGLSVWMIARSESAPEPRPLALDADEFVTGTSEVATVSLRDGTVVRLAPDSRLLLSGTTEEREVALKGRAYFAVAHDESRPFRIRSEAGYVTVLGTRFDLDAQGENVRVIVVEGRVALSAGGRRVEVGAGEMSRILEGTLTPAVKIPRIASLVDWLGNFLAFQRTPLAQVAREIEEEYGVAVEIADSSLTQRTVTTWFADKSLAEVVRIVCAVVAAHCTIDEGVVRIEPLPGGAAIDTALSTHLSFAHALPNGDVSP